MYVLQVCRLHLPSVNLPAVEFISYLKRHEAEFALSGRSYLLDETQTINSLVCSDNYEVMRLIAGDIGTNPGILITVKNISLHELLQEEENNATSQED